jgi:hypothetical protein
MRPRVGDRPEGEVPEASRAIAQRLRELPSELPPPFDWPELQRRELRSGNRRAGAHSGTRRRAVLLGGGFAAIAASLIAVVMVVNRLSGSAGEPVPSGIDGRPVAHDDRRSGALRDPEPMLRRAEAAERWLASEPDDQPVVQVSTYLVVTDLEDRIASMDDLLNTERLQNANPARVRALQFQRARLIDSLAQVRYAEMLADELP